MKQFSMERMLVQDITGARLGVAPTRASKCRWAFMQLQAEADYHEGYLKRQALRRDRRRAHEVLMVAAMLGANVPGPYHRLNADGSLERIG
jgi:hypothetical protein